jgi:hypothetical protein
MSVDPKFEAWLLRLGASGSSPEMSFEPQFLDLQARMWFASLYHERHATISDISALAHERLLTLGTESLDIIGQDYAKTTRAALQISLYDDGETVRLKNDAPALWYIADQCLSALGRNLNLVQMAQLVQDFLLERNRQVWPTCPRHDRPLQPDNKDNGAVWICYGKIPHIVSQIGQLIL